MNNHVFQKTIAKEIVFEGKGLHSGQLCNVRLIPAKVDAGVKFIRKFKNTYKTIPADFKFISKSNLCTTLESFDSSFKIFTVEHLLAAIKGNDIDNIIIEVSSSEIPALDGSAKGFDAIIKNSGINIQREGYKKYLFIKKNLEVIKGNSFIKISPSNCFSIDCTIDFPEPIKTQNLCLGNTTQEVYRGVLEARTFCFFEDIKMMKDLGLAKGGSLENAVVIKNKNILNEGGLRNNKEFVQHKVLDMIGDLSLSNYNLKCSIQARCPGHEINKLLMKKIFSCFSNYSVKDYREITTGKFKQEPIASVQI